AWVHTVDRFKIAKRLSDQRPSDMPPLNICLQVNIDNEPSKSGFTPEQVIEATGSVASLPNLKLRGLMAIPKPSNNPAEQRQPFAKLRVLLEKINERLDNSQKLDTLSMGMSGDLESAIHEGATIVRVGTDIFGPRY
ncbi:MAG: YggS family pyridoxal phosphate-dependent enzyme, partial [Porticoccaceae bacterium]